AGERKIAATLREFLERPAPPRGPGRQSDFDNQLVVGKRGRKRAQEELARLDHPHALRTLKDELRITGHCDPRHFRSGIGVRAASEWQCETPWWAAGFGRPPMPWLSRPPGRARPRPRRRSSAPRNQMARIS